MNYWHIVTATVQNTALLLPFFMSMGPGILQTTEFLTLAEGQADRFCRTDVEDWLPFQRGSTANCQTQPTQSQNLRRNQYRQ